MDKKNIEIIKLYLTMKKVNALSLKFKYNFATFIKQIIYKKKVFISYGKKFATVFSLVFENNLKLT
jgi:hypothetical protein